jgi:hypothetical protein
MQRWHVVQHELLPELRHEIELTPKLERLIHTLEWARVEELCSSRYAGTGCPPHERAWLADAFLAKPVLGLEKTRALHERLTIDRSLRRICGFPMYVWVRGHLKVKRHLMFGILALSVDQLMRLLC